MSSEETPLEEARRLQLPLAAEIEQAIKRERVRHEKALALVEAQHEVREYLSKALDHRVSRIGPFATSGLVESAAPLLYRAKQTPGLLFCSRSLIDSAIDKLSRDFASLEDEKRGGLSDGEWTDRQMDIMLAIEHDLGELYQNLTRGECTGIDNTTLFPSRRNLSWFDYRGGAPLPGMAAAFYVSEWANIVADELKKHEERIASLRGGRRPHISPRISTVGKLPPIVVHSLAEDVTKHGEKVLQEYIEQGGSSAAAIEADAELQEKIERGEFKRIGPRAGEYQEQRRREASQAVRKLQRAADFLREQPIGKSYVTVYHKGTHWIGPWSKAVGSAQFGQTFPSTATSKVWRTLSFHFEKLAKSELTPQQRDAAALAVFAQVGGAVIEFLRGAILVLDRLYWWLGAARKNRSNKPGLSHVANMFFAFLSMSPEDTGPEPVWEASLVSENMRAALPPGISQSEDHGTYSRRGMIYDGADMTQAIRHARSEWPKLIAQTAGRQATQGTEAQRWNRSDVTAALAPYVARDVFPYDSFVVPYLALQLSHFFLWPPSVSFARTVFTCGQPFELSETGLRLRADKAERVIAELRAQAQAEQIAQPHGGPVQMLRDEAMRSLTEWERIRKLYKATLKAFPQELINAQIYAPPATESNPVAPRAARSTAASALARRRERARRTRRPGGTAVGVARARDLANKRNLSERTLQRTESFFARHDTPAERAARRRDPMSRAAIAWDLWGGDAMRDWLRARRRSSRKK